MNKKHMIPPALLASAAPTDFHQIDTGHLGSDLLHSPTHTMFYTGLDDQASMRRIFHILESSNFIPAIKGSGTWWLRKSTARATLWMHERRAWETERDEDLVRLNLLLNLLLQRLPPPPANDNNRRDGSQDPLLAIVIEAAATIQRLLKVPAA